MSGRKFDGNPQNLQRGMPGLIPGMAAPTVMPGMASNLPGQRTVQTGHRPQSLDEVRHARTLNGKPIGLVPEFITQEERAKLEEIAANPKPGYTPGCPGCRN